VLALVTKNKQVPSLKQPSSRKSSVKATRLPITNPPKLPITPFYGELDPNQVPWRSRQIEFFRTETQSKRRMNCRWCLVESALCTKR
jgi:hypothetical protein